MNTQPQQRISINAVIVSVFAVLGIAGIVLAALLLGALWSLIGGVFVVGIIAVGLAFIGSIIFGKITDSRVASRQAYYQFVESMAQHGALPNDGSFTPIRLSIEAPEEPDGAILTETETAQYKQLALELIGITYSKLGQTSKQLIPFNKCAVEGIAPFNDVEKWTGAKNWLLNHGFAYKKMAGDKCIGTIFANGRTVGDVYKQLVN